MAPSEARPREKRKARNVRRREGARDAALEGTLSHAFTAFKEASESLERYYQSLESQVRRLQLELQEKNEALIRNAREKEALKELAERQSRFAAMGEMVAKIVHDVRNPLGSIELFSSLLRRELADDAEKRVLAEQVMHGVRTLNHALSNLLLFTRIPRPFAREVGLAAMIGETLQSISHGLRRREISVRMEVPADLKGSCDETLMKQVFLNLLLNALQAMNPGGRLEIVGGRVEVEGKRHAEVEVRDTGQGIPGGDLPRIFDPFFTTREGGTGLGLTIAHNILQAHGGSIFVESAVGEGSRFFIRLPLQGGDAHGG